MLYIANPSTQKVRFPFREPVNNTVDNRIELESGTQTIIGHGWTTEQTAKVIAQLERYGARNAAESHGRLGRFNGLLWRDMGEIATDEIEMANAADIQTREERSVSAATKSALGFDRAVRASRRDRPPAKITETAVRQDVIPGQKPRGNEVDFSLAVDPEGRSDIKLPV